MLALTFSFGLLLLFLFGGKKKKVTKRKTAVCSFGPAAKLRSSEAQELASLKQPALLFAVLCFSAFRSETEDGIFGAVALRLWRNRCGEGRALFALLCFLLSLFVRFTPFGRNRCSFSLSLHEEYSFCALF
ncbi:hypothetical protein BACPLE_03486 [Phocaeicola plebeius DSM 17135]|uniref:Uncharacterized protein n=1 Tax=Phocaeicola plebeius (strain DSM 17135 / JCM 12973 / CCUG 54634 / M2) TaxID=484018 RepID=B5D392_PHOPM|nr:hypothetical protein BACPLE_03486 [Phocaeicola plebeius DSM 17135]